MYFCAVFCPVSSLTVIFNVYQNQFKKQASEKIPGVKNKSKPFSLIKP